MGLSGGLSNTSLTHLLQCLTGNGPDQERKRTRTRRAGWPDGRRKVGTISAAVVSVLSKTGEELTPKEVHAEVERALDGSVSRNSVGDYLRTRSRGPRPSSSRHAEVITDSYSHLA